MFVADISPRLSTLFTSCKVTIKRNSDPYGVLSIVANVQETDGKASEPSFVELLVSRTGKSQTLSCKVKVVLHTKIQNNLSY